MITPLRFSFCILPITCCLLVALSSCKQKIDYSKEISRLDSASTALIGTEKTLLEVDTSKLHASYKTITEDLHGLSEKLSGDTVNKRTALLVTLAYEQAGSIHNLLENKIYLERAMSESKQRLGDLKHDLAENLIETNKAGEYIVNEINSTGKICDAVNRSIEKAKSASSKLDSLKTQITFLADSLNSK